MIVQDAAPEDWPAVWPFWRKIVAAGDTYTWDPDTSEESARALWTAPGNRVFVARDDDGITGSAVLRANYGGPAARIANAAFMVDPERTGRGVGRALAEHVLAEARREGYTGMVFNAVVETNPAVRLWTSLGFRILGTVPAAYDHPEHGPVGLHIMYRDL
ncbi:GNAT family N-acetyltransferase [Streptomyces sp. NPDC014894]|uniref:GNAT family N-acetyltransferase n=1 Tax=unclassified Streptomyces TaxID=2593676 RepID=UPI0037035786